MLGADILFCLLEGEMYSYASTHHDLLIRSFHGPRILATLFPFVRATGFPLSLFPFSLVFLLAFENFFYGLAGLVLCGLAIVLLCLIENFFHEKLDIKRHLTTLGLSKGNYFSFN